MKRLTGPSRQTTLWAGGHMAKKPPKRISRAAAQLRSDRSSDAGRLLAEHRHGRLSEDEALALAGAAAVATAVAFMCSQDEQAPPAPTPQPVLETYDLPVVPPIAHWRPPFDMEPRDLSDLLGVPVFE